VLGFGIVTPFLTWFYARPDAAEAIWQGDVRFFGSGLIGISAVWTLGQLVLPILRGLAESLEASRIRKTGAQALSIQEQDLPLSVLGVILIVLLVPMAWLLMRFIGVGPLAPLAVPLTIVGVIYVIVAGAIVAAVCGYMAGLIGASNSPVSGLGILGVVGAGLLLAVFVQPYVAAAATPHLVAFALFLTALIFSTATIANDNLQDLKTGQLVGATPWRQQIALMIGVVAGSLVIPFVLDLLNRAYGFIPMDGPAPPSPMAAPQAMLISALARGVLGAGLNWSVIGAGAGAGAVLIVIDAALGRAGMRRLPPLAVGLGVYLPMGATLPVVIGAVIGHFYEKRVPTEAGKRTGVLLASGFIVGDGLFGVLLAGLIVASGNGAPLALVGAGFATPALVIGLAVFVGLLGILYSRTARLARTLA